MKALWIDSGNDANYVALAAHGITHAFYDMFDPRVTKTYLLDVESRRYKVGLYMVTNWEQFAGRTPYEIAEITSARVNKVGLLRTKVQLDMEEHDPDKIIKVLRHWRKLQPFRDTSWTMESFQGGWMSPLFVDEITDLKIRVVPQYYRGDMSPVAEDVGLKDMLKAGFPYTSVTGFYDAAALPGGWEGFAFTMGRLP